MSKTATELAEQVLRDLVKLDATEAASAEDSEFIKDLSESYHDTLRAFDVNVYWTHDAIPEKVFFPLSGVLADVAARTFGVAVAEPDRLTRLSILKAAAARKLSGEPVKAEYY